MNASSCRSGKQVLSQLQEATQSHQVSSQGSHTPRKNTGTLRNSGDLYSVNVVHSFVSEPPCNSVKQL